MIDVRGDRSPAPRWAATRLLGIRGLPRFALALSSASAALLALLKARLWVPGWTDAIVERTWSEDLRKDLVWGLDNDHVGQTRYIGFVLTLLLVPAFVLLYGACDRLLSRGPKLLWLRFALGAFVVTGTLASAFGVSSFIGRSVVALVIACSLAIAPAFEGGAVRVIGHPRATSSLVVLGAETLGFAWTAWITLVWTYGPLTLGVVLLVIAAGAWRAGRSQAAESGGLTLDLDAITGAPFLVAPLLGLLREPSPLWLAAGIAIGAGLRAIASLDGRSLRLPRSFGSVLAPWTVAAIFLVPLKFRDLADANWKNHEGQHLGWINSVFFGKFLMADAGFIYTALREYILAVLASFWGVTLEGVRLAHILLNLAGLLLFLEAGRRVTRGRLWLQAWLTYLLVTHSPIVFFLDYRRDLSFGWSDLARSGIACFVVVLAVERASRISPGRHPSRKDHRVLLSWGSLTGLSALYSHDFGLCAFGALALAIPLDRLLRRTSATWPGKLKAAVTLDTAYVTGFVGTISLFVGLYAAFGRADRLVTTFMETVPRMAAGIYGALGNVFDAVTFLSADALMAKGTYDIPALSFILPLGICVLAATRLTVTLVRGHWNARASVLLALLLFCATSLRHALLRSDTWHLMSGSAAPDVLLVALAADAARLAPRLRFRRWRVPLGAALVAATALWGIWVSEGCRYALKDRAVLVLNGEERPSTGPAYDFKDLPRVGDVNVQSSMLELVRYVREHTSRHDPILVRVNFLGGEEIYFLSDRRNPTRFDVMHEMLIFPLQREAFVDIVKDPPAFVIGGELALLGKEANMYIRAHWKKVKDFGSIPVFKYEPPL